MEQIYLTRRNLVTLMSKLDRAREGEYTTCTIVKRDNVHPTYPQTMAEVRITAVEDEKYYTDRVAGAVHPADDPALKG